MKITVTTITPNEDMEIEATVNFWDESVSPHNSAKVTVFIPQTDEPLSVVKATAIQKAKEFLRKASTS